MPDFCNGKAVIATRVGWIPEIIQDGYNGLLVDREDYKGLSQKLWLLLLLLKTRAVKIAWLFGASLAFGMLIHINFLFLLLAPTVIFGIYMLFFQENPRRPHDFNSTPQWVFMKLREPFAVHGLLPAALLAIGITAAWYLPHH